MYKKIALLSTFFSLFTHCESDLTPWIELKPSYFFFSSCPMNDIYDKGGFEIQGSVSVPVWDYLDFYGSIGYRIVSGHALNTGEKTRLSVLPIDIGLKPVFNVRERVFWFFAIGPRYFYFHQRNNSPYVDCSVKGSGFGLFVNTGLNVLLAEHFLLGAFGEYSYEKKSICPCKPNVYSNGRVQLGGFAFGVSLGYAF